MANLVAVEGFRMNSVLFYASNGFSYHFNRVMKGGRVSLRCINYERRGCRARASVGALGNYFREGKKYYHNHPKDYFLIHQRRFRTAVLLECRKKECLSFNLKRIYHNVRRMMRIPQQALLQLTYKNLRPSMQNARNSTLPQIPHCLSDLALILNDKASYGFLTTTLDGEDNIFLGKFGQTMQGTRLLIFATWRALQFLSKCTDVMSDATFSSVPSAMRDNCAQVWSIVVLRRHHVIVLARIMMQTKSQACYETALNAIRLAIPNFRPTSVMCDFETAQANAWLAIFPYITVNGCLFHSSKAIATRAKELGLSVLIRENENVDSIVRSLCALALLPWNEIFNGLRCVSRRCHNLHLWGTLEPLFSYVRNTWYSPSKLRMFSVFGCPDRTSNACESANAMLRSAVHSDHPNVWTFMYALNHLEDVTNFDLRVLDAGFNPSRKRRASALANDQAIIGHYEDLAGGFIDVDTFLRRASRRMQNVYNLILHL